MDSHDDVKKKMQRDVDALQQRVDALTDENDRMNKSKKKMQTEVHDITLYWYLMPDVWRTQTVAHYTVRKKLIKTTSWTEIDSSIKSRDNI